MAKDLIFSLGGRQFPAAPVKLERAKIYGWSDTVAVTADGEVCHSAYLSPDDGLVIPSGALKQGTVDDGGRWLDKASLTAVGEDGKPVPVYPSSFDAPIELKEVASDEEFLDNDWDSVYQISHDELAEAVGEKIYKFGFSYRGGINLSSGYLVRSPEGLFLFAGSRQEFPLVSLAEETAIDTEEDAPEENIDEMDFSMF